MKSSVLPVFRSSTLSTSLSYLRELKKKYRPLYSLPVERRPDGSVAFHHGRLYRREGISVLHLKGDAFEMAFQHGKLLEGGVRNGVLMQLSRSIPHLLQNSVSRSPLLNRIVIGLVEHMGQGLRSHIPWEYLAESFALSEGSGLALHHVSNSLLTMEAMYILAKYAVRSSGFDITPMAFAGCSSAVAWNEHTADGGLVVARNLDYPLNGFFDDNALVTYYEPTDHGQRYIALGTAGLHTPSLTTINESGIYLAGHLIPTAETSFEGTPMYFVAADVIRNATTFDEAVTRFRQHRTTVGWSYVLVSTKERRVASVEMTNERVAVRESHDGFHFQTNHFSLIESSNLHVNRSVEEDTYGRYRRLEERARSRGVIGVNEAMGLLGDCFDPQLGRERGLGATVAVHLTVGSAVLEPEKDRLFVATGRAPTSQNDFVELPLWKTFDPGTFATQKYQIAPNEGFARRSPKMASAVQHYIKAKMAYEYDSDLGAAATHLRLAIADDPENPAYHFVLAVILLKQGERGEALEFLSRVIGADATPQLLALARYYRGRIHAHQGKRDAANVDFERALRIPEADPKLHRAAAKAQAIVRIFGRFTFRTDKLPLMMQFADMLNY